MTDAMAKEQAENWKFIEKLPPIQAIVIIGEGARAAGEHAYDSGEAVFDGELGKAANMQIAFLGSSIIHNQEKNPLLAPSRMGTDLLGIDFGIEKRAKDFFQQLDAKAAKRAPIVADGATEAAMIFIAIRPNLSLRMTNAEFVQELANRAVAREMRLAAKEGRTFVVDGPSGTRMHEWAKRMLNHYQGMKKDRLDLHAEVRYLSQLPWKKGQPTKGSVELDVVEGDLRNPIAIYDYKFAKKGLTESRLDRIQDVTGAADAVIIEVRYKYSMIRR